MHPQGAPLASLATQLQELTERAAALGEQLNETPTEDVAATLFEVERALRSASRAIERARRQLP
jgi:hypothetical protein